MAEALRNTAELQKQLTEFQDIQRQMQLIYAQKQQLTMQVQEIKIAQEELSKSEKGVYRYVGSIMIETSKADAGADLKDKLELFEMRLTVLDKQENKLKPRMDELRDSLEKMLRAGKGQA
ncbi:Prefoldin subunit beta [uncultured archaeon]|nr:Prefoldin subunit beta [uncultured archaeon]